MPVEVSLLNLAAVRGASRLFPAEFGAFLAAISKNPDDRVALGAAADWLDEVGESELARAFRFVSQRPAVKLEKNDRNEWCLSGLPDAVASVAGYYATTDTVAGVMANLYWKISAAEMAARKVLEGLS